MSCMSDRVTWIMGKSLWYSFCPYMVLLRSGRFTRTATALLFACRFGIAKTTRWFFCRLRASWFRTTFSTAWLLLTATTTTLPTTAAATLLATVLDRFGFDWRVRLITRNRNARDLFFSSFSISRSSLCSSTHTSDNASPVAAARPVRPIRWT